MDIPEEIEKWYTKYTESVVAKLKKCMYVNKQQGTVAYFLIEQMPFGKTDIHLKGGDRFLKDIRWFETRPFRLILKQDRSNVEINK